MSILSTRWFSEQVYMRINTYTHVYMLSSGTVFSLFFFSFGCDVIF